MTLEEAMHYVRQSVKLGYTSEEEWDRLTDEQLIAKATRFAELGDLAVEEETE